MSFYRDITDVEKEATRGVRVQLAAYLAANMPELSWPEHRLDEAGRNPIVTAYQLLAGLDPDGLCGVRTQRSVAVDVDSGEPHLILRPPAEPGEDA